MKGAYLLSKNPAFFAEFGRHLKQFEHKLEVADRSIKLTLDDGTYFLLYDRCDGNFFEEHEIPLCAETNGYIYAFLVECRSEAFFCDIVSSYLCSLEILVCDSDCQLYRPNEVSPESIVL